ncbi:MAG: squalene/phytoene synthase family protein, partial [Cyclobacteriaceae bacterium]
VGLMCLCVFVNGDREEYERLKYSAQRLGAAFQKVNFLRDLKYDSQSLGRVYFPQLIDGEWNEKCKAEIEADIRKDFDEALIGIKQLPKSSRLGVFLAYKYYRCLLHKIASRTPESVMNGRIRVSNRKKMQIMLGSYTAFNLGRV